MIALLLDSPRFLISTTNWGLFQQAGAIIETIIDQLKNISQIEHSRHRSPTNFVVHLRAFLIAYCHQPG